MLITIQLKQNICVKWPLMIEYNYWIINKNNGNCSGKFLHWELLKSYYGKGHQPLESMKGLTVLPAVTLEEGLVDKSMLSYIFNMVGFCWGLVALSHDRRSRRLMLVFLLTSDDSIPLSDKSDQWLGVAVASQGTLEGKAVVSCTSIAVSLCIVRNYWSF